MKTCYKFIGDYNKLKKLGYNRMPFLEGDDGYQIWGKKTNSCSIMIIEFVSVKIYRTTIAPIGNTYIDTDIIAPYIKDLIKNKLVKVVDYNSPF